MRGAERALALLRSQRMSKNNPAATRARPATPPTTPPAMAPAWLSELTAGLGVGVVDWVLWD